MVAGELDRGGARQASPVAILDNRVETAAGRVVPTELLVTHRRVVPGLQRLRVPRVKLEEAAELLDGCLEVVPFELGVIGIDGLLVGKLGNKKQVLGGIGNERLGRFLSGRSPGEEDRAEHDDEPMDGHLLTH